MFTKKFYQREEWIDGRWLSLGNWDGDLEVAIAEMTWIHERTGHTVRIVERSGDKTETVFYKRKESPMGLRCPDCDNEAFPVGPSGGLCTNYKCAVCGSEYNVGPGLMERIHR